LSWRKKHDEEEKYDLSYWSDIVDNRDFITARMMVIYIIVITIVTQTIGFFLTPNEFLIWNALTFIVATNLGAVLLAIKAQKSAEDISERYNRAFNEDFYHTLFIISQIKKSFSEQAGIEGKTLDEEVTDLGENLYGVVKGYMQTFNEHMKVQEGMVKEFEDSQVVYEEGELFE
tara:strand:- start:984 stop:1505 length:522 start_codon:yes stop_codon:yes gene_type:complete